MRTWFVLVTLFISSFVHSAEGPDGAAIFKRSCAVCHHPGGWGPFSLLTYDEVRPRARQIADMVRRRLMPPWKPQSGYGDPFVGERLLNDEQIARTARVIPNPDSVTANAIKDRNSKLGRAWKARPAGSEPSRSKSQKHSAQT